MQLYRKSNLTRTGDNTENHASNVHGTNILLTTARSVMRIVTNVNRNETSSQLAIQVEDYYENKGGNYSRSGTGGEHTGS